MGCTKREREEGDGLLKDLELPSMEDVAAEVTARRVGEAVQAGKADLEEVAAMEDVDFLDPSATAPSKRGRGGRGRRRGSGSREHAASQGKGGRGRGRGRARVSEEEKVSEDTTDDEIEGVDD